MDLYHIYNRGNHREQICFDIKDLNVLKKMFFDLFGADHRSEVISLCIMPNHFHLLAAIEKKEFMSIWMREIGRNYTVYMNRRHRLEGKIFQGPYKKRIVDDFIYFRTLVKYMRDNPKELLYSKHLSKVIENQNLIEYYDFFLSTKILP